MINEFFTQAGPSIQQTLDILGAKWISNVPIQGTQTGSIPLFNDRRIDWLTSRISISGLKVLELGSFEAGHTFMLSNAGGDVTAIESNSLSFLKGLIAKEVLGINANFIYGDFIKYLENSSDYDLIVASGVLYHMENPVELLCKISAHTPRFFLWTHYFDNDTSNWNPEVAMRLEDKFEFNDNLAEFNNFKYPVVTQRYLESLDLKEFCGGPTEKSAWMFRDDIIDLINKLGFQNIEIVMENRDHKHGPSFAIYAEK